MKPLSEKPVPIVTIGVLLWCTIVFIGLNSSKMMNDLSLTRLGFCSTSQIYNGAWWGLITTAFVHIQMAHFFFNMYWLYQLGPILEREFGPLPFAAFIVTTAVATSSWELAAGQSGIGFSGVGYAMVGVGWIAGQTRTRLKGPFNDRVFQLFLVWGIVCVVFTYLDIMNVGNVAHASGLVIGILMGIAVNHRNRVAMVTTAVAIVIPLALVVWNPLSPGWLYAKGSRAMERSDYASAIRYFRQTTNSNEYRVESLQNLAQIYAYENRFDDYVSSIDVLKTYGKDAVEEVTKVYGDPESQRWLNERANVLIGKHQYRSAEFLLRKSLTIDPKQISPWESLAEIYSHEGDHAKFEDAVQHFQSSNPDLANELRRFNDQKR